MANTAQGGVIKIDSTGNLSSIVKFPIRVKAIDYTASADTWLALIQFSDGGQTAFRADSNIADQRNFFKYYGGVQVTQLFVKTLTDIDEVLIYYEGVGK